MWANSDPCACKCCVGSVLVHFESVISADESHSGASFDAICRPYKLDASSSSVSHLKLSGGVESERGNRRRETWVRDSHAESNRVASMSER